MARFDLRVAETDVGRGLFACRAFAPGELILKLAGDHFSRNDPIHDTESGANLLQTGWRSYILPDPPGVFANHSCDPNAGIAANRRLVAIRAISPDEEIRFDYSTTMAENFWTMSCRCGTPRCRHVIRDFKELPRELQTHYLHLGVVQRFIASTYGPGETSTVRPAE
jgi:hypothetical protein